METIRLARGEWHYDPGEQLGQSGGFGTVFAGTADGYASLAVKRLHITAHSAAHRELRLAEELAGKELRHVIQILDAGQDADSDQYFVVMPRAERSLQDELLQRGRFADGNAAEILLQIARGLSEVPNIVHRDLKPANVLFHDGRWRIADFGIARFVEENTSLHTLKNCLTRLYAAPEQWRMERATAATDIYALGCVGYALLKGQPPFRGPDFSQQHQHEVPAPLNGHLPQLQSLLAMMLRKPPQSRPSIKRVIEILLSITDGSGGQAGAGLQALAKAGASDADEIAHKEAERAQASAVTKSRADIAAAAFDVLHKTVDELFVAIETQAPSAHRSQNTGSRRINLGKATLRIDFVSDGKAVLRCVFASTGWDVIAIAGIKVQQHKPGYEWGASLWYTNLGEGSHFRWYECSYFECGIRPDARHHTHQPFFLGPNDADEAHGPVLGRYHVAYGPLPIDDENVAAFCDRWAGLLAKASQGRLSQPSHLPINESWL